MCLAAVLSSGADGTFNIGVVANSSAEFKRILSTAEKDAGARITNLRTSKRREADRLECQMVVATARFMKKAEAEFLRQYVQQGGLLVAMHRAGEYEDNDGDGKRSPGDRRVWAFSKLCGVRRQGGGGRFRFVRIWGHHPIFTGLQSAAPIDLTAGKGKGTITVCESAVPIASGYFEAASTRKVKNRRAYGWFQASRTMGECPYFTVKRYENGTAVYIADDLSAGGATPQQKAVLRSLLSSLALTLRQGQLPAAPLLADKNGNLVYNGNMENVGVVLDAYSGNDAKPPFDFPLGWWYNTWGGGRYEIMAKQDDGGSWYYSGKYTGEPGVAANSDCVLRYRHFAFRPRVGKAYTLSYRLRASKKIRVGIWGRLASGKGWRRPIASAQTKGDGWHKQKHTFRIPADVFPGDSARYGFFLDFALSGDGRIALDDVVLKENY